MKNSSVSLVEYEDIYTLIFGLTDELVHSSSSLQFSIDKLNNKEADVQTKYSIVLQCCQTVYKAFRFL
jgi:hypothetical protein